MKTRADCIHSVRKLRNKKASLALARYAFRRLGESTMKMLLSQVAYLLSDVVTDVELAFASDLLDLYPVLLAQGVETSPAEDMMFHFLKSEVEAHTCGLVPAMA
jgi:hypothetical protein